MTLDRQICLGGGLGLLFFGIVCQKIPVLAFILDKKTAAIIAIAIIVIVVVMSRYTSICSWAIAIGLPVVLTVLRAIPKVPIQYYGRIFLPIVGLALIAVAARPSKG